MWSSSAWAILRGGCRSALDAARANVVVKSPLAVSLGISTGAVFTSAWGSVPSATAARYAAMARSAAWSFAFCTMLIISFPLS